MNCIQIKHNGNFYNVFKDDIYIMYYFFSYNIKNGKCGFPNSSYNKVINTLEEIEIKFRYKDQYEDALRYLKNQNNMV